MADSSELSTQNPVLMGSCPLPVAVVDIAGMNTNRKIKCAVVGLVLALGSTVPLFAADEESWTPLFDGKKLTGWTQRGGKAVYKAEDGVIVGSSVPDTPNSFLCTDREFANFVLELEFKVDPRLNSGVQIRSQSTPTYRDGVVHGYQVEIDPSERAFSGGIYDESRRGWLNDLKNNEAARKAFKQNEWNAFRIVAVGDSIKTWLNGVPAADLTDSMTHTGFIALQVHAASEKEPMQVRWRNIRVRDLGTNPKSAASLPASRPAGPVVLLGDRGDLSEWVQDGRSDNQIGWQFKDGLLEVVPGTGNLITKRKFRDFRLYLEFNVNHDPAVAPETDGNSGVYLQRRYEIQILNSHGREPKVGECGAIYATTAPASNASRPAGQWQSYDITFHAARWDAAGAKTANARVTVIHNGVKIHDDVEIPNKTGLGQPEGPSDEAILLQEHGHPVRFRNIWIVPVE